jgi:hypothetical protein
MKVPTRVDKGLIASISRLLGGKPKGKKGEALLSPEPLPTLVSKDAQLPIVFRVGTNRFQGKAVRLYCAGLKCTTDQKLPPLYASVTIFIPLSGNRKVSQIEVLGDVTRVKPEGADTENNGLFEVRLSMRTDKVHLELYRALLESMSK